MSDVAALSTLVFAAIALQTFWVSRSLGKVERSVEALKGELGKLDTKLDAGLARVDARLDDLKTEIVRDHGERIAKLEQHIILHP